MSFLAAAPALDDDFRDIGTSEATFGVRRSTFFIDGDITVNVRTSNSAAAVFFNSSAFGKSVDRTTIFVRSRFKPFTGFICDLKKPVIFV